MSPPPKKTDSNTPPTDQPADARPESHIEDVAESSPQDERVAELLGHTIDVPVLASAVEQQEAADAAVLGANNCPEDAITVVHG